MARRHIGVVEIRQGVRAAEMVDSGGIILADPMGEAELLPIPVRMMGIYGDGVTQ